ncbi:hypothetical protein HPB48_001069 [Haemaphysalis longicornis]|uniref:Uncharacterized protein n=1 Tax=Haemaphysalis longicornis TaxID=44386 RepID=A0A9J6GPJ4_HAELO|nr:hypothetical protein HPB48_001069 [Haemaphysalis longicornis]
MPANPPSTRGTPSSAVESLCATLITVRDAIRGFPSSEASLNWVVEAVHRLCSHDGLHATLHTTEAHSSSASISGLFAEIVGSLKRAKTARRQGVAFHHHDALLGTQLRHSVLDLVSSGCCLASLCGVLLNAPFLSTQALFRCGVCCCMALDEVFVPLLRDFNSRAAEDKHQILQLLQKCLCGQMGLFLQTCFTCRDQPGSRGEDVRRVRLAPHSRRCGNAGHGRETLARRYRGCPVAVPGAHLHERGPSLFPRI